MFPTKREEIVKPGGDNKKVASAALDWARNLDGDSDFEHNLKTLAQEDHFPVKQKGFVAYMVQGYLKSKEQAVAEVKKGKSDFVGSIDDKLELELTLEFHRFFPTEDNYGYDKDFYKFRDANDNVFVWWSSGHACVDWLEIGSTYLVRGTVRSHDVYREDKQTALTNCTLPQIKHADWSLKEAFMAAARGEKGSLRIKTDSKLVGIRFTKDDSEWEIVSQYDYENGPVFARKVGKRGNKLIGKERVFQQHEIKTTQMVIGA
jgi:hypothetical protein